VSAQLAGELRQASARGAIGEPRSRWNRNSIFKSAMHRYREGSGNRPDAGLGLLNRRSPTGIGRTMIELRRRINPFQDNAGRSFPLCYRTYAKPNVLLLICRAARESRTVSPKKRGLDGLFYTI
jgi:hypothetical protein